MDPIERITSRASEESEFARAAEEERTLYSLMIRLKLGDLATKQRIPFSQKLTQKKAEIDSKISEAESLKSKLGLVQVNYEANEMISIKEGLEKVHRLEEEDSATFSQILKLKEENEATLNALVELSAKIRTERSQFKNLAKELATTLKKSSKAETIEKEYERQKGEQLVLQNAVNNKLIMLVNERTRTKDSIAAETGLIKTLKEQLGEVLKEISEQCAVANKRKESLEDMKNKIKVNKEKLEKINFGAKVKLLSLLNSEIEAELGNQKVLDEILKNAKYGLKSAHKVREGEQMIEKIVQGITNSVEAEKDSEIALESELTNKSAKIQEKIYKYFDKKRVILQNLDKRANQHTNTLRETVINKPMETKAQRPMLVAKSQIINEPRYTQSEIDHEKRINDWLNKTQI